MIKTNHFSLFILLVIIVFLNVACENKNIESNLIYRTSYFNRIGNNTVSQTYGEGFSDSYYYDLDSDYEITLELILKKDGKEVDKIKLNNIKQDTGDIDGTFGILVDRDIENNKITWTLRHDERTNQIISTDFFKNMNGQNGSIGDNGIIEKKGNTVLFNEYDVEENIGNNIKYEWSIELKIYETNITKKTK
jgi:hypothetical protein